MRRGNAIGAALAALFSMAFALTAGLASANDPAAVVKGGGSGVLTDPGGNDFPVTSFRVRGVVADDGSAKGKIRFRWRGSFPEIWGDPACEGTCDTVTLTGNIESGSVASDGTVTLSGTAREIDRRRGEVLFDSGFDEPFYIVAGGSRHEDDFILQWCLLPEFQLYGSLSVEVEDGDDDDEDRREQGVTASSFGGASCSR
jgi:hypothetical protein